MKEMSFAMMFQFYFGNNFIRGYRKQTYQMEKQKLAEMVLQKMKQKKEQEERNRPHFEVLRLEATFSRELNVHLKDSISQLEALLAQQRKTLEELQSHLNQIDNTGKKSLPRIVVMPEFIASENIGAETKEFYRKSSNSFLRTDIIRNKGFDESVNKQKNFLASLNIVRELEETINKNKQEDRRIINQKRIKVLKEDLRLRFIREEQRNLRKMIAQQREDNKQLLNEYQIKKVNLQNRKDRLKYVCDQIQYYKKKIEETFNPITYREHLKNVFAITIKNQIMQGNLNEVTKKVESLDRETKIYEKHLEKTSSLLVLGRTSDSPANKLGKIKKRLDQQRQRKSLISPQSLDKRNGFNSQRSLSQNSIQKSKLALDFSTLVHSSGKASIRTTDRTTHRKQHSSISRTLF